jgi:ketosteroid isomerase-like protein
MQCSRFLAAAGLLAFAASAAAQTAAPAAAASPAAPAASPPTEARRVPPPVRLGAAECEVWERELSFAQSVERHDADAFRAHLHPGAAFISGPAEPARGADAVVAEWTPIIRGEQIVLRWHPRHVVIGGEADIAHSRGPYWIENADPAAAQPYLVGQFVSIWKRVDGEWKVLFDGGGGGKPEPASAAQVEALRAGLDARCPRA